MTIVCVRLFGEFRNFSETPEIEIMMKVTATVQDLKTALRDRLKRLRPEFDLEALLSRSVLADENRILSPEEPLAGLRWFALLPPVSGG